MTVIVLDVRLCVYVVRESDTESERVRHRWSWIRRGLRWPWTAMGCKYCGLGTRPDTRPSEQRKDKQKIRRVVHRAKLRQAITAHGELISIPQLLKLVVVNMNIPELNLLSSFFSSLRHLTLILMFVLMFLLMLFLMLSI